MDTSEHGTRPGDLVGPQIRVCRCEYSAFRPLQVYIHRDIVGMSQSFVQKLDFVVEEPDSDLPMKSCLSLKPHDAQILMDDLWECGLRPSEGAGSAGSLAATQRHLADLKTILFHKLGIQEAQK